MPCHDIAFCNKGKMRPCVSQRTLAWVFISSAHLLKTSWCTTTTKTSLSKEAFFSGWSWVSTTGQLPDSLAQRYDQCLSLVYLSQKPSRQFVGGIEHVQDPWERFIIRAECDSGSFQVTAQNHDEPYNCLALPLCCASLLLLAVHGSGTETSRAVSSFFLFLDVYAPDFLITSIGPQCLLTFSSRKSQHRRAN